METNALPESYLTELHRELSSGTLGAQAPVVGEQSRG